ADSCAFPCLNGGQCVQSGSCDCSLYQATGHRCQTVPNPGFEREMTCRTWGQYNFETFDGLYFYFPGRCTYTLLRDCQEATQAGVVVQVHNDPACNSAPYTCRRAVSIFLPWEGEVRLQAAAVTFKGQSLQLPHRIHDLQLEQISQYVLVTQQQGFTLAWEGSSGSVYIKLSPEFVGRTCGMCGNFNADVQDDLKTSYGVLTHDIEMFGNSWMEAEPREAPCPLVPSGFSSPCAAVDANVLLKVEEVCAMLLDPPFQSCHEFVSPLSYMASCSNDLCLSGAGADVLCQVFSEYARACAHADHPLHDWRRHIPSCARPCSQGLGYRECISCCPASCGLERACIDSKLACLDGCYCPDGLIYEDGRCVTPSDCPCEHRGQVYPPGHSLQEECNNCTCVGGVWSCTNHACPGECSVTGDMYFQSFDGRIYTFSATCQYVLAKSRNSGRFTVTLQNAPCGANLDGACIQSVNLVIDEDPRTEITLSHVGEVYRAGQYRVSLPYSDDLFHIQELSSMFLQVRTAFGLRLQYSWAEFRLYLQADEHWRDDTVGLCGTFNGNIQDDFLSPSGMIESTPQLFGNAWRVSSACVSSLMAPQLDPCDTHQQAVAYASEMCDVLNQAVFSACHQHLSPTAFHQQCRSDTCRCGTPCLCSALAHYAHHCRRFSVIVDFRSRVPDCAITCPATMQYGTCVSSCQGRCSALSVPQHCGEECEEGCVCPPGTFYNHRTRTCVHRSQCPCSFLGADYEPGDVIMTSAGVQLCLNGKLVSQATPSEKRCPAGQTYHACSEDEDGVPPGRGVACERTCESYLLNLTCSTHEPCVPGCSCAPGLLKHGDECFEPASCPCLWKGKEYYPGDRVSSPCHQCVCQHGAFQCDFRPCPSMCTAYGDRHYRTFDGLLYDYIGACSVYLVKSTSGVMFSVAAANVNCLDGGVVCRKALIVTLDQSVVAFDDETGKPNASSVADGRQRMFVWSAGYFTLVHFPRDVTVLWDRKTTVHIQVGPRWQGKLSGLCGNFDTKTVNEMRTPDNLDSPTAQEFGNSWSTVDCVNSLDIRHPCSLSPLREPFAKRQCAVLLGEVFQACHPVVDVTWFYANCLADTCSCSRGGDCECFCTSVAAYAQRCCHQGVPVDWRSPSLCPYDCEFYNKVLGKGPFRLITFRDRWTLLAANSSGGSVFLGTGAVPGVLSQFMVTPGLSRARPHDASRVSFEAAERPNFFLYASPSGQLRLAKWEEKEAFWEAATFVLRRNTWMPGYDSLESLSKPSFFLHASLARLHLLKYRHTDGFRKATLFRLAGPSPDTTPGPRCQWRYDSCAAPCFRTCSDPTAQCCSSIPHVEGCLPVCPPHMVLDQVTHRCVYVEDCQYHSPSAVSTHTPSAEVSASHPPTIPPSGAPDLSRPAGPPSPPPTTPPVVQPERLPTVRVTEAPPTSVTSTTSSVSPTTPRTSGAPFAITAKETREMSTRPSSVTPATTSTASTGVSDSVATGRTTVTSTVTGTTKTVDTSTTITATPAALPSTASTTSSRLPTSPSIETTTISEAASVPSTAVLHTAPPQPATPAESATPATLPVAPTTTSVPTAATTDWRTATTKEVTTQTTSQIPGVASTTPAAPPLNATDTTPALVPTSTSSAAPTRTERTTQTSASTAGLEETVSTATTAPASPPETTTGAALPKTDTSTRSVTTLPPSEPPHVATTSTPVHTPTAATSPRLSPQTSVLVTSTTGPSRPPVSSTPVTTSGTPGDTAAATTTSPAGVSSAELPATTSRKLVTPPPVWGVAETTVSTGAPPVSTTLWPVVVETTRPASTTATTTSTPSWSPVATASATTTRAASPAASATPPAVISTTGTTRQPTDRSTVAAPTPAPVPSTTGFSTTTGETVAPETTTPRTAASPSTAPAAPAPVSTPTSGVPTSASAPPSAATTAWTSPPGVTTPGTSPWPHVPSETTQAAEAMTSTAAPPPPYAEMVDECTKYICVNQQLVLFNKSQSCPFASQPPNCGLLGFAILVNGDKCCPKWDCPCRCSMFPDLNVITFDGNSVAVYKAASYVLAKLPSETVTVLVQECPADAQSPLLWNFTNLCLAALDITHKSNRVTINRLQRRLYVNSRYAKPRFRKFGFEVFDTGNMYLIRTPAGLKLQWFHSTGMLVMETDSSSNKLATLGLCGICDGDARNDLTLASGTALGEGEDPSLFIDSWQVPNTTSYVSQSRRRELNCSTSDCSVCFDMLEPAAFWPCHAFVPPSTFCDIWVRDEEYVNNQCVALAAYAASCHKFNVCIEWRRPDHCPFICPGALQYQACLTACTAQSCPNQDLDSDPDQCSGLTEGCVCPAGTLLHRPYSALCIPPEKCACTDSSGVPRTHGEVWKASQDGCCLYRCDNDTIVPVEYDCSSAPAPVCHRTGETVVSLADDSSCCPQKVCVCNQSLCHLLPPACKYGEKWVSYYRQDSCCPDYVCECSPDLCETDVPSCRDDQTLIAARAEGSCCLAHICICSACPEAPPVCLQGEVLTVDPNTTDRCCPSYQCACDPHRCPQLTCPVGMSLESVPTPGRCCPNQTCECSCDKIASPKCGLGEAAQLDRNFLSDPQNQCACKRYKCVREAVCVFGERGVLRPGQTLVEHDDSGLCHSRQCSRSLDPASGFYLLRTSTINCSAHCQPNQIYIPPKDQSTCCGVCKNISCLYEHENGTAVLYKPGRSWVSNCRKFDCTDTLWGPTLISYALSCPPFNETECTKVGGTVVSYMDGCCKTCKEDGKSCQKVTVRMTIRKNDCRSNRPVNIVSCDGKCPSASIYNYNINTYARFCKCCRETGLQRRSVQLYCSSNSTWVGYSIQEPTDCSCQWS
uniref:Otogelin n=1 Tax=Tetraodon nigroviridis TaxID=99883 RepID=H3DN78_TETNG